MSRRALLEVQYTVYGTLQVLIQWVVRWRAAAGETSIVHIWRVGLTAFGRKCGVSCAGRLSRRRWARGMLIHPKGTPSSLSVFAPYALQPPQTASFLCLVLILFVGELSMMLVHIFYATVEDILYCREALRLWMRMRPPMSALPL